MNVTIRKGVQMSMLAVIFSCAACSEQNEKPPAGEKSDLAEKTTQMDKSVESRTSTGETLDQQVAGAISDLATRTGVASSAITINKASVVEWGSSALGCPKEGMNYTQAIVPGVLLILESDDVLYRYHGRSDSKLSYCPPDRAQEPAYGPGKEFM